MENLVNNLLDILFPSKCLGCSSKGDILCEYCISKIPKAERETSTDILAVYDYRDKVMKEVIWKLKYHHERHLGDKLGRLLYENFLEEISELKMFTGGEPIYVIPVPISHSRKRGRGYNQSEVIAKKFCRSAPSGILSFQNSLVEKIKNTIPQAKITNRKRRIENMKEAFNLINKNVIKGKTCIVIDDVTTTGATIGEIMKLLKKVKAKKVIGLAVAH